MLLAAALALALADPTGLAGAWSVDLRPTPAAPAYLKPMKLQIAADGALTGEFYGAPIQSGRAAQSNGRTCFAFNTADASGPYHHAGCLKGEAVEGQTWSTGRGFFLAWRATREPGR